jgi:hypothetical protein
MKPATTPDLDVFDINVDLALSKDLLRILIRPGQDQRPESCIHLRTLGQAIA